MVGLVLDTFLLEVIFRKISGAIHNVSDADLLEHGLVLGDKVGPQPHKAIDNLRANSLVKLIFIFFTRGALEVKILIVELIWRYFVGIEVSWRTVPLALHTRRLVMVTVRQRRLSKLWLRNGLYVIESDLARVLLILFCFR